MPLIPLLVTFLPLLTALTTLLTVENVRFALLMVPFLPLNLLALTADIPAFIAFEYFETFLFTVDLTPLCTIGLSITLVAANIRSSIACSSRLRSAAPRSAAACSRASPCSVSRKPNPRPTPVARGKRWARLATPLAAGGAALVTPIPAN